MARHPQDDWGSDPPKDEQPKAEAKPKAAAPAPTPEVLAQMATHIYGVLIMKYAAETSSDPHAEKMADAIERAQNLWLMAHAAPTAAPVNTTAPFVEQNGNMLACTMGTWENEPTGYAYQWHLDGTPVGQDASWYQLAGANADAGHKAMCLVTARNGLGATEAPPSNEVEVKEIG